MTNLNKDWSLLVSKNYSWSRFPERGPLCLLSDYINFIDSFSELTGIVIPNFPGKLLNEKRLHLLQTAKSVWLRSLRKDEQFFTLIQFPTLLGSLTEL